MIAIIGILITLMLRAVQSAREAARRLQCGNHFKQVGLAMHGYHSAHDVFPPGMIQWDSRTTAACGPSPAIHYHGFGWSAFILPYMEQLALHSELDLNGAYPDEGNRLGGAQRVSLFLCPADVQQGELVACCSGWQNGADALEDLRMTNMAGVADSDDWTCNGIAAKQWHLTDGLMGERTAASIGSLRDGASNTLMIGEVTGGGRGSHSAHFWVSWDLLDTKDGINGPGSLPGGGWASREFPTGTYTGIRDTTFSSYHPVGCHFILADGSVHFLSENISAGVLKSLTTRAGGDIVEIY